MAVDFESLPVAAVDMAKAVTLDGLAVMLAGATEPLGVGRISIEYVREMGGAPQASVIAGGFKTSMINAAYANGTMAHALDFDNTWYPLNHPTSPTLPAILAIAEHYKAARQKVIEAIAAAFEVQGARAHRRDRTQDRAPGFHKPGTTGHVRRGDRGREAARSRQAADADGLRARRARAPAASRSTPAR